MEKIETFDITIKGYKEYKNIILKTYPKQHLELKSITKSNGYNDVHVYSIYGKVGELFSEDSEEIFPYLDNENYLIETYIKKSYKKDEIYEGLVLIINIFKKDTNFIEPVYDFMGNYVTNYQDYIFDRMMNDDDEIKCSITEQKQEIVDNIDDYEVAKLVIESDKLAVYYFSYLVGYLSKKISERIIPYLRDEHKDVEAVFRISVNKETYISKARLEVWIKQKKYLKYHKYIGNESLLIEGVELVKRVRERKNGETVISYVTVDDKDLDKTNSKKNRNKGRQKEESTGGCSKIILIILIMFFLIYSC